LVQTRVLTNNGVRTVAPLGVWNDWIFSGELHKYSDLGYEFKVLKGYTFGEKVLFKDYITDLYEIKEKLSAANDKGNPMYLISKLLMNSLYGRFGMSTDFPTHKVITDAEFEKQIQGNIKIKDVIDLGNGLKIITTLPEVDFVKEMSKFYDDSPNVNVAIAASITSYARIFMADYLANPEYDIPYMDTDCLVMKKSIDIGVGLGNFSEDNHFKEAIFAGPKTYGGVLTNGNEVIKVKGYSKPIGWDIFKELNFKDKNIVLNHNKRIKHFDGFLEVMETLYTLKATDSKREILFDTNTNEAIASRPYYIKQLPNSRIKVIQPWPIDLQK